MLLVLWEVGAFSPFLQALKKKKYAILASNFNLSPALRKLVLHGLLWSVYCPFFHTVVVLHRSLQTCAGITQALFTTFAVVTRKTWLTALELEVRTQLALLVLSVAIMTHLFGSGCATAHIVHSMSFTMFCVVTEKIWCTAFVYTLKIYSALKVLSVSIMTPLQFHSQ